MVDEDMNIYMVDMDSRRRYRYVDTWMVNEDINIFMVDMDGG